MNITPRDAESMAKMYEILHGHYGKEAKRLLHNWLLAWSKAQKLRRRGYRVSIPLPRLGRPQFILVTNR